MLRTQVYLTEQQDRALKRLAATTGKKQSELIRSAIDQLLKEEVAQDWKATLRRARGLWAGRDDLDQFYRDLRAEWDRRLEPR
jgi:Arc/MetJ-type ribon-helix-helix transcriptional regulator